MATEKQCCYCSYEEHLSTDIQCPVVGIGEPLDNASLLAKYGTLEAALKSHGLRDELAANDVAKPGAQINP